MTIILFLFFYFITHCSCYLLLQQTAVHKQLYSLYVCSHAALMGLKDWFTQITKNLPLVINSHADSFGFILKHFEISI